MIATGSTDVGKRRPDNQDNYYINVVHGDGQALCVVCDGMGGARSGNVASDMTLTIFVAEVKKRMLPRMSMSYMRAIVSEALRTANAYTFSKSLEDEAFSGMGSTIVAALVDGDDACVMNAGDSRAYLVGAKAIRQVTTDHSVAQEMVRRGELTPGEARRHPSRNYITRAVGTERTILPQLYELRPDYGDVLLLCTDGLYNMVEDAEIYAEVSSGRPLAECAKRLIALANERGGPDNITVTLLKF
ncbi:MAG: Stp1/IreP family PP2C-type Ser/Thr phosphatase [Oscillospiraceae bacterium]|nr:Stp1/IreP family PP2C-type Ser/Thr phosphatase [Oscillospiraceae bacterium]